MLWCQILCRPAKLAKHPVTCCRVDNHGSQQHDRQVRLLTITGQLRSVLQAINLVVSSTANDPSARQAAPAPVNPMTGLLPAATMPTGFATHGVSATPPFMAYPNVSCKA